MPVMQHAASAAVVMALITLAEPQAQSPRFDVASVRVIRAESGGLPTGFAANPRITPGRVTWTTTLHRLTMYAFDLPAWRILGMREDRHYVTIAGTTAAAASADDVRAMLRHLLADRFNLVTHTATEERSGYALVVAKNGPKLQRAAADGTPPPMPAYWAERHPSEFEGFLVASLEGLNGVGGRAITGRGVPVSRLAAAVSAQTETFVIDRTGLSGLFYFGFLFTPLNDLSTDAGAPSLFSALEEELGLELERERGPVEFLVVDHIEKTPTSD